MVGKKSVYYFESGLSGSPKDLQCVDYSSFRPQFQVKNDYRVEQGNGDVVRWSQIRNFSKERSNTKQKFIHCVRRLFKFVICLTYFFYLEDGKKFVSRQLFICLLDPGTINFPQGTWSSHRSGPPNILLRLGTPGGVWRTQS